MSTAFQTDAFQSDAFQILAGTGEAPVTVPDVVGQTQAVGTATLEGDGFVVVVVTAASSSVPAGTIISQAPEGGSLALSGATVTITVSTGEGRRATGWDRKRRRNYVYQGKRYFNLSNEDLVRLIARDAIDITREDIKVSYKNQKPHIIAKDAWADLQKALESLGKLQEPEFDDDDDIESIIALL
jgi:PASTA domain